MSIGKEGLAAGFGGSLFESKEENEGSKIKSSFSILKTGANVELNDNGAEVGIEGKLIRKEFEDEKVKLGVGLNLDTGVRFGKDGVKAEALGFGFSFGRDGVGIKLPFFDIKFKN